jgi:hypothetical protein
VRRGLLGAAGSGRRGTATLVAAVVAATLCGGCDILGYNDTKLIAAHTMIDDRGRLDMATYTAALRAKFPAGSPVTSLESYVTATKGSCHQRDAQTIRCEIPVDGAFCVSHLIGIDAVTDSGAIKTLEVQPGNVTC